MSALLLTLWIATLVADRVDFLGGTGAFLLTPFLVITPVVLAAELVRTVGRGGRFSVPRGTGAYAAAATVLLVVIGISVFFSFEVSTSAKRYALLVVQVYGTLATAVLLGNRPDAARIVVRGAYLGLALGLLFNALQVWAWLARGGEPTRLLAVLDVSPNMYGPWFPRLSGQVLDQNRAGMLFVIYCFVIAHLAAPSRARTWFLRLGALLSLFTISRSVLLMLMAMWVFVAIRRRSLGITRRGAVIAMAVAALPVAWLFAHADRVEAVVSVLDPLTRRFSTSEGSASMHFQLIGRAWDVATENLKTALLGIGFGNAYAYVQDIFPGVKYGNFHSMYLTLLAEGGVFALGAGVLLLVRPIFCSRLFAPLLLGIAVFNVFYQVHGEPVFWLVLTWGWMRAFEPPAPQASAAPASVPALATAA